MTEHIAPYLPLDYRYFKAEETILECDGHVFASDALCDSGTVEKKIPAGTYIAGYEYSDKEMLHFSGVRFILKEYLDEKLTVIQPKLEDVYRSNFGVDSGTAMFVINSSLFKAQPDYDMAYDRSDVNDDFTPWGWQGHTVWGDGGYTVELIENLEHYVVGFRVDFSGLEKEDYYKMVADGIIDFDEEFMIHWFGHL